MAVVLILLRRRGLCMPAGRFGPRAGDAGTKLRFKCTQAKPEHRITVMKKLTLLLAVSLVGAGSFNTPLRADDENIPPGHKKNGVPPGLQKKGGLPPGQAKKQAKYGQTEAAPAVTPASPVPTTVNTPPPPSVPSVPTPATPVPPAPPVTTTTAKVPEPPKPPAPQAPKTPAPETAKPSQPVSKVAMERRAKLDMHVGDLDIIGKNQAARDQMFVRMNRRLDVPLGTLESELKAHPKLGIGGLLAGHIIARRSKQPAGKIFAAHDSGKSWGEIAGEHKVDLSELNESMAEAKEAARSAQRESAKR